MEIDRLQSSLAIVGAVIDRLEKSQFMIEESQKRDAEAEKERQHRIDEGLEEDETEEESRTDYAQGMYDSGMCEKDFL